jgi:Fe-S cluster assembly protein SufD
MPEALPVDHYSGLFERRSLVGLPSWLPPLQRAAQSRFRELGFPGRNDEEWRFTDVRPIAEIPFHPAGHGAAVGERGGEIAAATVARFAFEGLSQIVFVDGRYAPELSTIGALPGGAKVVPLSEALQSHAALLEPHLGRYAAFEREPFVALNTSLFEEGALVYLPRGVELAEPIHLLYVGVEAHAASHPRTLIVAEANSRATLVESYAGPEGAVYFTNAVTEVVLGENAAVDHYKLQRESDVAFHIAHMSVRLKGSSNFSSHSITFGGAITRNDVVANLAAEHIECTLNGLYLGDGRRVIDNHTTIDHAMPNCDSHEVYKGILDDASRGVFNGKIFVRQDAQKTDAKQTNRTLLLSEDAQINTKPQLEIFADDVKCTHGATVGQLNADQLFYLRTRGIPLEDARALLVYAFASDIVSRIKVGPVREALDEQLLARLPAL